MYRQRSSLLPQIDGGFICDLPLEWRSRFFYHLCNHCKLGFDEFLEVDAYVGNTTLTAWLTRSPMEESGCQVHVDYYGTLAVRSESVLLDEMLYILLIATLFYSNRSI